MYLSCVIKEWLQSQGIDILPWPALSPDLNPIENAWGHLARAVCAGRQQFETKERLEAAIIRCWDAIEQKKLARLIESMSDRCASVLLKGGKATVY